MSDGGINENSVSDDGMSHNSTSDSANEPQQHQRWRRE
jgi:hypothetical protein